MLTPFFTTQFKKDFKLQEKRNKNIEILKEIITRLISQEQLSRQYRDHPLLTFFLLKRMLNLQIPSGTQSGDLTLEWKRSIRGHLKNFRECHIEPDWLLMYRIEGNNIYFTRTGTHSDLFE